MNFAELSAVNAEINKRPYTANVDPLWQPIDADDDGGTCSNYAVAKFRRLVALGWPKDALRLACCWVTEDRNPLTDYHATLWVDLDDVTWELSNGMELRNVRLSPWDYDRVQEVTNRTWEKPAL